MPVYEVEVGWPLSEAAQRTLTHAGWTLRHGDGGQDALTRTGEVDAHRVFDLFRLLQAMGIELVSVRQLDAVASIEGVAPE